MGIWDMVLWELDHSHLGFFSSLKDNDRPIYSSRWGDAFLILLNSNVQIPPSKVLLVRAGIRICFLLRSFLRFSLPATRSWGHLTVMRKRVKRLQGLVRGACKLVRNTVHSKKRERRFSLLAYCSYFGFFHPSLSKAALEEVSFWLYCGFPFLRIGRSRKCAT